MKKKKNILVTGGAGYIGSHIVQDLCNQGQRVFVFDNFSLGHRSNIHPQALIIEGDVRRQKEIDQALSHQKIDMVFHFAAWKAAGESMTNPMKYADNNICGTLTLLNAMIKHDVQNIVFSSSAAVYGDPQYLPVDEKHPTNPANYYGYTKLAIEENLRWYSELKGLNYAALRYFNATGYDINGVIRGKEKNPANLSPVIMETAVGIREKMMVFGDDYDTHDGTCIRDYIHVSDLASAHLLAMNYITEKQENLLVNLGTGSGHTVLEMIKAAGEATGLSVNYEITGRRAGDPRSLVASCDLAGEKLGWQARHSDMLTIFKTMHKVYSGQ